MGLKSFPLSETSKVQIIPLSNPQKLGLFVGTSRTVAFACRSGDRFATISLEAIFTTQDVERF